jgi:hypothetical protein
VNITDFCDKLEGFYDNWFQAAKDPARYAHIKLKWERIGDNEFKSKQWYHYLGEDNPYRRKWHRVSEQQGVIIVQNWTPNWGEHNYCCDMMFFDVGDFYDGKVKTDACIINGGMLKSTVQFNGTFYKSRDQGWRDDKVVWGSNVIYEFQKTEKPLGV